jgi:ketosteroid isomerase-like protein
MTRDEEDVRSASADFYRALNRLCRGDPAAMPGVWHQTAEVTTVHPLGEWAYGWEEVWAGWQEIARIARQGAVVARDVRVALYGQLAYTTCVEDVTVTYGEMTLRWSANVTNIFQKEGAWKMIHHHSDKAPQAEEAVERIAGG